MENSKRVYLRRETAAIYSVALACAVIAVSVGMLASKRRYDRLRQIQLELIATQEVIRDRQLRTVDLQKEIERVHAAIRENLEKRSS